MPIEAYNPENLPDHSTPFFMTVDNGPAHSFYLGENKLEHLTNPGFSLMQLIFISPHGHDIHQIVEHVIGFIKRGSTKEFKQCVHGLQKVERSECCKIMYEAVLRMASEVKAESIAKGQARMFEALKLIGTVKGKELSVLVHGKRKRAKSTGGDYSPLS